MIYLFEYFLSRLFTGATSDPVCVECNIQFQWQPPASGRGRQPSRCVPCRTARDRERATERNRKYRIRTGIKEWAHSDVLPKYYLARGLFQLTDAEWTTFCDKLPQFGQLEQIEQNRKYGTTKTLIAACEIFNFREVFNNLLAVDEDHPLYITDVTDVQHAKDVFRQRWHL